jgi:hypothetical protein
MQPALWPCCRKKSARVKGSLHQGHLINGMSGFLRRQFSLLEHPDHLLALMISEVWTPLVPRQMSGSPLSELIIELKDSVTSAEKNGIETATLAHRQYRCMS